MSGKLKERKGMAIKNYDRLFDSFHHPVPKMEGLKAGDLPKGVTVKTAGGNTGTITGKQTKNAVQIKLCFGELCGEYDWLDKEAIAEGV
jgi:hypothetical protein